MNRIVVLIVAVTLAACFSPTFNDTTCGVNEACPPGFHCVDGVCRQDGMNTDAASSVTLTITRGGNASGTVTSDPAGIDCGSTCAHTFEQGTEVTLTAMPAAGAAFTRWTGGLCSGAEPTCTITLTSDAIVNAEFVLAPRTITVAVGGNGSGTVTSVPVGINCPGACGLMVPNGTSVTLTAEPAAGSFFLGWSGGGCAGTGTCTTTVDGDVTVNASFGLNSSLVVTRTGTGGGTVTSSPAGINCGMDCNEVYTAGTIVTLTAVAAVGSTFNGWSGGGCTGTGTCVVTINQAVMVSASFTVNRYTLGVALQSTAGGMGTVTSSPAGINCGTDCSELYDHGTVVTLTATPDATSLFTGWVGACSGNGSCIVTMDMARSVTASFAAQTAGLNVAHFGSGGGTVTSAPAGINCGTDCSENFSVGAVVTLTATPDATSNFAAWSGAGCSGTGTCVVTISGTDTVTATFLRNQYPLTVSKTGAGSGTVTSAPAGVNCGVDCAVAFDHGTTVVLTATAAAGSRFVQWTGACTGSGTCSVFMDSMKNVTAEFQPTFTLSVSKIGSGTGTVTSTPAGINCGADCTEDYASGASVSLTATPSNGSRFVQWTGACTGTGACNVTMSQARSVTAEFRRTFVLTVVKAGTGVGTVTTVAPSTGINCGADCTETYDTGTAVTLSALAATSPIAQDSTFTGWSGGGCSGTGTCITTLNAAQTVTATFTLKPNFAFVTSTMHTGNLGGLSGADAICQARANAASLPGTYRAWLSSDTVSAASRLGTASGWIRPDGKPFALSQADLFAGAMIYPLRLTESGSDVTQQYFWSQTLINGTLNPTNTTCANWTSASVVTSSRPGNTSALGENWADDFAGNSCSAQMRLSCFGIDRAAPQPPLPAVSGRRVFRSNSITPSAGLAAADAVCNSEAAAAGLPGTYRAMLATTTASAASRFNTTGQFVRPDNAVVAQGNAFFNATFWDTAIETTADGFHLGNNGAWTGATSPTALGTVASTCNNWSSTTETGMLGRVYDTDVSRAFTSLNSSCTQNYGAYCVQL